VTKKLRTLAGVTATLLFCSTAFAQQGGQSGQGGQPQTAPTPKTKVAIINLQYVVKSYDRWKQFEDEYKRNYKGYDEQFEQIKKQGLELKARLEKMRADDPEGDNIKRQLKDLDRKVQDLGDNAKKQLLQLQDNMSVQIYAQVEEAVSVYAKANDLDLVLQYNDGVQGPELHNAQNIQRKMQTGALMPIYSVNGMDISNYIIYMLNAHYKAASTAVGSPNGGQPRQQ
jgi:Skp family chaperone for outer membrane proteins